MRYYISDLHFFHGNLNERMDFRGFATTEEMNEHMIERWNSRVRERDEVIILGDFSIGKGEETNEILKRLRGRKSLIVGNHDDFLKGHGFDPTLFEWMGPYREISDNKRKVILSHYPVFCYNGQYRLNPDGTPKVYMLYGHVHNTYDELLVHEFQRTTRNRRRTIHGAEGEVPIPCHMINCFCMFSDYLPLTLDEWIRVDEERRARMDAEQEG